MLQSQYYVAEIQIRQFTAEEAVRRTEESGYNVVLRQRDGDLRAREQLMTRELLLYT